MQAALKCKAWLTVTSSMVVVLATHNKRMCHNLEEDDKLAEGTMTSHKKHTKSPQEAHEKPTKPTRRKREDTKPTRTERPRRATYHGRWDHESRRTHKDNAKDRGRKAH